ncbi:hypothetical protein Tco_0536141 [Tanacetum coccineum]
MKNLHPILLYRELAWNARPGEPLRLLGLQIGATHVGVAISDVPPKGPVSLHCVYAEEKGQHHATKFKKACVSFTMYSTSIIKEQSVGGIVVGEVFVDELNKTKKLKDVQYTIWDDMWSESKGVGCLLDPLPLHPEVKKVLRDREIHRCATGILQISRLESRKSTMDISFTIGSAKEVDNLKILQSYNGLLLCSGLT